MTLRWLHLLIVCFCIGSFTHQAHAERPNILLIMADDLGFSDLGCYGSEIATPHLDKLAADGLRYTQFYNTARCWPTRAALLTGYYAQQVQRDSLPGLRRGNRPAWAKLVAERLKTNGYRTYHSGKWHLDSMPLKTGFDKSFYLKDQHRFFNPTVLYEDDRKLEPVERGSGFYGTTAIGEHAVKCLKQHADQHATTPFFHYLAFTAPHFPLHALPQDIAKYSGKYDVGWEAIREKRFARIRDMEIVKAQLSAVEPSIGPPYDFPESLKTLGPAEVNRPLPWNSLNADQRKFQAQKMEIHAAMIDRMDQEIGKVLRQLDAMNALENTLIFFLSDNGASAEIMVRGDGHDPQAAPGSAASHLCLGPGWSTTCNTPFRRHKTWVHEGGTSTPLIAHWPKKISARGALRHAPGHVVDIVPTILEAAEIESPHVPDNVPSFPGKSLLTGFSQEEANEREIWWSHEDNRALRIGDWKLVAAKGDPWELYNLADDRTEQTDLASNHPERVSRMAAQWQARADEFVQLGKQFPTSRPSPRRRNRKNVNKSNSTQKDK